MAVATEQRVEEELLELEHSQIQVNPYQPRRQFDETELEQLAKSIESVGLIQPPVVRYNPVLGGYELISGERRFRASQLAGMKKIRVLVRRTGHEQSAQAALIENIQRVDLNPLEIARALKNLQEEFGFSQDELSKRVGKKRSTVANYLRLLLLPTKVHTGLNSGLITMGHAKVILSLDSAEDQIALFDQIVEENLTVRGAERAAMRLHRTPSASAKPAARIIEDVHYRHIREALQEKLATKVGIDHGTDNKGSISIEFYSLDDLDRLLETIGIKID